MEDQHVYQLLASFQQDRLNKVVHPLINQYKPIVTQRKIELGKKAPYDKATNGQLTNKIIL